MSEETTDTCVCYVSMCCRSDCQSSQLLPCVTMGTEQAGEPISALSASHRAWHTQGHVGTFQLAPSSAPLC